MASGSRFSGDILLELAVNTGELCVVVSGSTVICFSAPLEGVRNPNTLYLSSCAKLRSMGHLNFVFLGYL